MNLISNGHEFPPSQAQERRHQGHQVAPCQARRETCATHHAQHARGIFLGIPYAISGKHLDLCLGHFGHGHWWTWWCAKYLANRLRWHRAWWCYKMIAFLFYLESDPHERMSFIGRTAPNSIKAANSSSFGGRIHMCMYIYIYTHYFHYIHRSIQSIHACCIYNHPKSSSETQTLAKSVRKTHGSKGDLKWSITSSAA